MIITLSNTQCSIKTTMYNHVYEKNICKPISYVSMLTKIPTYYTPHTYKNVTIMLPQIYTNNDKY